MFKTENEVIEILKPVVALLHPNTQIRVGKAVQEQISLIRKVTFFVVIPISVNRDDIIKIFNELSIKYNREIFFSGSEAGFLHSDLENDWFFITAEITQNL